MNKQIKKIIATLCMGAMALSITPTTVMAETIITDGQVNIAEVSPRMQYIRDIVRLLAISGNTATVSASTEGYANEATKAKIIVELQVKSGSNNWIPVKIWTEENDNYYVQLNDTHTVTKGNTYRLKVTATVWVGSLSETQIVYGTEKTA